MSIIEEETLLNKYSGTGEEYTYLQKRISFIILLAGIVTKSLDRYHRRNANLSLRKLENTSATRFYGFKKKAVITFCENPEKVLKKYALTPDQIYNFDMSGIFTVLTIPKEWAERNQKQIGQLV